MSSWDFGSLLQTVSSLAESQLDAAMGVAVIDARANTTPTKNMLNPEAEKSTTKIVTVAKNATPIRSVIVAAAPIALSPHVAAEKNASADFFSNWGVLSDVHVVNVSPERHRSPLIVRKVDPAPIKTQNACSKVVVPIISIISSLPLVPTAETTLSRDDISAFVCVSPQSTPVQVSLLSGGDAFICPDLNLYSEIHPASDLNFNPLDSRAPFISTPAPTILGKAVILDNKSVSSVAVFSDPVLQAVSNNINTPPAPCANNSQTDALPALLEIELLRKTLVAREQQLQTSAIHLAESHENQSLVYHLLV